MKTGLTLYFFLASNLAFSLTSPAVYYSGAFLDSTGYAQPLNDTLRFVIYTKPQGGAPLWEETHFVKSEKGTFSVLLGDRKPLDDKALLSSDSLFLEIFKGNTPAFSRIKVGSVFFAFKSNFSDSSKHSLSADSTNFSLYSRLSDSTRHCDPPDTVKFAKHSQYSDSSTYSASNPWSKIDTNIFLPSGSIALGMDTFPEKLNINGSVFIQNSYGDARLVLKSSALSSIEFKSTSLPVPGNLVKLVPSEGNFLINMWDSLGKNERIGVITIRHSGNVLEAKGNIRASNFIVDNDTLNVPDYVFNENHKLKSIQELECFTKNFHHLPDIPSRDEINSNGLDLVKMDLKLLEKIEELTLYIIQQEKRIEFLEGNLAGNR